MSNAQAAAATATQGTKKPLLGAKPIWGKSGRAFVELAAMIFWLYAIIKLFIFDIDVWLVTIADARFVWVLNYKAPILLLGIVIAMLMTRSVSLGFAVCYIVLYPFVILFWKIPRFVWRQKSWLLAFAIINALISFVRSFKRDFTMATALLVAGVLIASFNQEQLLYPAAGVILSVLTLAYALAFTKAFKPSAVFQIYKKMFPAFRRSDFLKVDDAIVGLPVEQLTTDQITIRTNSLQNAVLYNRACLLISRKLRDYQRSKVNFISYIVSLLGLLALTVIAFALINFAAFKIDPALFQFNYSEKSFFVFLYYSAGNMFYATNGMAPILAAAQALQMLQFFFSVLLLIIFIAIIITMKNEKYAAELEEVVQSLEKEGRATEGTIRSQFNIDTIASAIKVLEAAKAGLVGVIIFIGKDLND